MESSQNIRPSIENNLYQKRSNFIEECLIHLNKNDKRSRKILDNLCQKYQIGQAKTQKEKDESNIGS